MRPYLPGRARRQREKSESGRWAARKGLAVIVGAAIFLTPIAVAIVVSFVIVHHVHRPTGGPVLWLWWMFILATPWLVYVGARRLARRALPLAALLRMTLVFPDRAPSRIAVARRAGGTKTLERQLARDRQTGRHDEPVVAAERILGLAASLSRHDRLTRGHSERVRALADVIAEEMKIPQADRDRLRWSALLHDIGKLSVPGAVLNKPGKPDEEELALLRRHPDEGARLAAPLAGWLGPWARSIPEHHEKFDGTGYPRGLAGEEISLGGRIVAVADCFETMTAVRSYKKAMTTEAARRELADCAGTHFDPVVVRAFLEASLAKRSLVGAPLATLGDLSRFDVVQSAGRLVTVAGHFVTGALVATGIGVAAVLGAAHTGPHNSPAAAATVPAPAPPPHDGHTGAAATPSTSLPRLSVTPTTTGVSGASVPAPPPATRAGGNGSTPSATTSAATTTTTTTPPSPTTPPTSVPGVTPTTVPVVVRTQATVPGIPTGLSAMAGNGRISLTWRAPASDGGSAVTGYVITPFLRGVAQPAIEFVSAATGEVVGGLVDGDTYTFTVQAVNSVGLGDPSSPSAAVTPSTVPGAPTDVTVTPGNASATVAWTAPSSDGGSPVTGYTVTATDTTAPADGGESCTWTTGPPACDVTGLTNGDSYTFVVTATNAAGEGAPSSGSAAVTPDTVPGAPTGVTVMSGNASATVDWTAPSSDGGSPVTGYTVVATDTTTPSDGGQTSSGVTGPITVGGLVNGDTYTFTVQATSAAGAGAPSSPSPAVTPATVPGAPTIATVTPGDAAATLDWTAPSSDGGSPVTGYTVVAADTTTPADGGESCTWTAGPPTCDVTGLTNGDSYTFTVQAVNGVGPGAPSSPSPAVVPVTVPDAPTAVSATAGAQSASVTFAAPFDGGSAISGYTVVATDTTTPANGGQTGSGSTGPITVTGLTDGDSYTFVVTAVNAVGAGSPSYPSNAVTPVTTPGAPTIVTVTPGNASATVAWAAPSSDGGSPVTGYQVVAGDETTPANGGQSCTWTTGPLTCTVTGLTNGDHYVFGASAINGVGSSVTSALFGPVIPPSGDWAASAPATSPSSRATSSEAWDPATGQLILFGGGACSGGGGGCAVANDTWSWTGSTWTQLAPSSSPPPLAEASLAFDPAAGQLVLFGGIDSSGNSLSGTWVWNGSDWIQESPSSSPPARHGASLGYDPTTGQLILYGGSDTAGITPMASDTWAWNGTDWTQLAPLTSPPPLYAATMDWDSTTGQLILFGGTANGTYDGTNETWAWTGTDWTEEAPASSPPARLRATMAMDPASGQLLLFGGYGVGQVDLGDMWAWNGSTWAPMNPPTLPGARADASMAFDVATGKMVLFGGSILEGAELLGDTWLYS